MNTVLRRLFFLRLLLPLAVGIVVGDYAPDSAVWQFCLAAGAMLSLSTLFFRDPYLVYRFGWLRGMGATLALFALGMALVQLHIGALHEVFLQEEQQCTFRLYEVEQRATGGERWLIKPDGAATFVWLYPKQTPKGGHSIGGCYQARLLFRPIVRRDSSLRFDYALWSKRRGVTHVAFINRGDTAKQVSSWRWSELIKSPNLMGRVCRSRCIELFRSLPLGEEEQSILIGLTLGDKRAMSDEVKNRFRLLGISHLLAVSGLHVGILFSILLSLLGVFHHHKRGRAWRYALALALLWIYAAVTGFTPSVVRATIMCLFYTVAKLLQRRTLSVHTLLVTAFVILLFRPFDLFDVGFQLSFMAVLFILFFLEVRMLWWPDLRGWRYQLSSFVAVSTGAQVGVLPLTFYYFGSFQPLFLLSNLVAVPLIPFVMLSALLVVPLALTGLEYAFPFFVLQTLLRFLAFVSEQGGALFQYSLFTVMFTLWDLFFAYVTLGCLAIFVLFKQRRWFVVALAVVLVWSLSLFLYPSVFFKS